MDTKVFPIAAGMAGATCSRKKPHSMLNAIIIVIPPGLTRIGISEDSDCADFGSCDASGPWKNCRGILHVPSLSKADAKVNSTTNPEIVKNAGFTTKPLTDSKRLPEETNAAAAAAAVPPLLVTFSTKIAFFTVDA